MGWVYERTCFKIIFVIAAHMPFVIFFTSSCLLVDNLIITPIGTFLIKISLKITFFEGLCLLYSITILIFQFSFLYLSSLIFQCSIWLLDGWKDRVKYHHPLQTRTYSNQSLQSQSQ